MAFEGLTDKLQNAFRKLSSKGKLTEADVKTAMREVRMALLEADVNYLVVKDFVRKVTERAVGADILASLTPGQQVIKIVNEELTELMGGQNARLNYSPQAPTIYMLCGLQGAGKTTLAGKLVAKVRTNSFTLEDYLDQIRQLGKMGSITDVLKMIPGVGSKLKDVEIDEDKVVKAQKKNEAIILSMTRMERRNPDILNASRKRRIAAGSGATVQEVNLLLKQFEQARDMMKSVMGGGKRKMRIPFGRMPR